MAVQEDRRPTLASWPKRIYDWEELPERFFPALERWRAEGLPPGNVTYIPKVHQYKKGSEYVTAWWGDEVLVLWAGEDEVCSARIRPGEVARVTYTIQLLKCSVELLLGQSGTEKTVGFSYNRTKEDQLLPILNLLLGQKPEYLARAHHPSSPALEQLRIDSYAMYHDAKLCYRLDSAIRDILWVPGRYYGLAALRKQRPEYFWGRMDRGIVAIQTDFYARRVVYLTWDRLKRAAVEEKTFQRPGPRRRPALVLDTSCGESVAAPLLPDQIRQAEEFIARLPVKQMGV